MHTLSSIPTVQPALTRNATKDTATVPTLPVANAANRQLPPDAINTTTHEHTRLVTKPYQALFVSALSVSINAQDREVTKAEF
tara:strand:+ start:237 stop:485 length:249 start_codon:yes stop_codon:yes gene_type:complete